MIGEYLQLEDKWMGNRMTVLVEAGTGVNPNSEQKRRNTLHWERRVTRVELA